MNISPNQLVLLIEKCFYITFLENSKQIEDFEKSVTDDNGILEVNLRKLKETESGYKFLPLEADNFTREDYSYIQNEFKNNYKEGGYLYIILEKYFNRKFKENFNKLVPKYFSLVTDDGGHHKYDYVNEYLRDIKNGFDKLEESWEFEGLKNGVYKRAAVHQSNAGNPERIKNPYSAFKLIGQGNYSKILIGYRECKNISLNPKDLCALCIKSILSNEKINRYYDYFLNKTKNTEGNLDFSEIYHKDYVTGSYIFNSQIDFINYQLMTFYDDYIPSDLDRITPSKNKPIKEVIRDEFEKIIKQAKYKSLYLQESSLGDMFTKDQVAYLNREIEEIKEKGILNEAEADKISKYSSVSEKIEFLAKIIKDYELDKIASKKSWKEISDTYFMRPLDYDKQNLGTDEDTLSWVDNTEDEAFSKPGDNLKYLDGINPADMDIPDYFMYLFDHIFTGSQYLAFREFFEKTIITAQTDWNISIEKISEFKKLYDHFFYMINKPKTEEYVESLNERLPLSNISVYEIGKEMSLSDAERALIPYAVVFGRLRKQNGYVTLWNHFKEVCNLPDSDENVFKYNLETIAKILFSTKK